MANNNSKIQQLMLSHSDVSNHDLTDVILSISDMIKKFEIAEYRQVLSEYTEYVIGELPNYFASSNNAYLEITQLMDSIKYKINSFEKEDIEEELDETIKLLKKFKKNLKFYQKLFKTTEPFERKDKVPFELLNYCFKDEDYYLSLKTLIKKYPEISNMVVNDKPISIYILDLYISNFKKMIEDKNSDYINKDYLREVYFLFTHNYRTKLSSDDKKEIDDKLLLFSRYIGNTIIKRNRKNVACEEIKTLTSKHFYDIPLNYEYYDFDDDALTWGKTQAMNNYNNKMKYDKSMDVPVGASLFGTDSVAYTLLKNDDVNILKIHALDIHSYITEKSTLSDYLYNCLIQNEKVDSFIKRGFTFSSNQLYDVISYNLVYSNTGVFLGLSITSDKIKISDRHGFIDMRDPKCFDFVQFYQKVSLKNGGGYPREADFKGIYSYFNDVLNEKFVDYVDDRKIPCLYYGKSYLDEEKCIDTMNDIGSILSTMDASDFRRVYDIFTTNSDQYHFSVFPITKGSYKMNLMDPISYIGLETQRMIADFIFDARKIEDEKELNLLKKRYTKKYLKIIDKYNSTKGYVDVDDLKRYKGKIKK